LKKFKDVIGSASHTVTPMTEEEFPQHYCGRRRKVYLDALESLRERSLSKSDADCKCFLKKEKDIASDKADAVPRVITFPSPRFGLSFGRFVKPIEEHLFRAINEMFDSEIVMKGKNYVEVGRLIHEKSQQFIDPWFMDCDVSRLDSSISDEAQGFYHKVAQMFYDGHDRDEFATLCRMQLNVLVKGRAGDGGVRYRSQGLGSGQMNTSQLGVLIVCLIILDIKNTYKLEMDVVNCGDDFTIVGEKHTILKFKKRAVDVFSRYNMILKTETPHNQIERVTFCQTSPVEINGIYRMVRNPTTAIPKDSVSRDNLNNNTKIAKYMKAISECGIATHGGVPIFQEVYRAFSRAANHYRRLVKSRRGAKRINAASLYDNSMSYWGQGLSCSYGPISERTRESFYYAYGITPQEQKDIEEYYSLLSFGPSDGENSGDVFEW